MKAFLLATVSMVALTSVARTSELPGDMAPLSSTPAAGWKVGHIGFEGGTTDSDSLTKNVTGPVSVLRLHPDSRIQPSHDSALAAHAQVASPPKTALPHAAGEARPRAFSINEAISLAVLTNPGVGEASANRRATESTLRQAQGFLLPQVRLNSSIGPEKFTQAVARPPAGNGTWLDGKETSVVVRQLLFDGFASIHEIWRQAARVNAAAFRVLERTELIALDAAEAYIDVVRYLRLVTLATRTSPATKSCSPTCNHASRADAPAKATFSRLSSASRRRRQHGRNSAAVLTTPDRNFAESLAWKRSTSAFPLRFGAFRDRRMMPWRSRCSRIPRCWQRSPTGRPPKRHFVPLTELSFPTYRWRAARRVGLTPIPSSAGGTTSPARSSCPGIFSAAARMSGGGARWPSVTPKKRCGMRVCSATPWKRSTEPGRREQSPRTVSPP
jgi:hypothetical protein